MTTDNVKEIRDRQVLCWYCRKWFTPKNVFLEMIDLNGQYPGVEEDLVNELVLGILKKGDKPEMLSTQACKKCRKTKHTPSMHDFLKTIASQV